MISWRVFVASTPNRCRHLVLTRLNRFLQVCGLPCLPPRCGTWAVPASTTKIHERVVIPQCSSSKRCPKFFDVITERIDFWCRSVGS